MKSEKKLDDVIRQEMTEIRDRYGDERRTELIDDDSATLPIVENKPAAEDTAILRLRDGQLRRMSPRMVDKYLAQPGAKDDVVETIQTATDETLYFFTNKGNCFMLDVSKIPETMRLRDRGSLLTGLIAGLADHEHAVAMVCVKTEEMAKKGDFLFITKNGQVKRTTAAEYGIRRARFAAINPQGRGRAGRHGAGGSRRQGRHHSDYPFGHGASLQARHGLLHGRATAGVRGMDVGKDDEVRWFEIPKAGDMLLVLSDRGFGKRMLSDDVERQGRAGKGQKLLPMNKTGETGTQLAACLNVTGAKSARVEQRHGHVTVLNMDEIAVERRTSKGQLLINVLLDDVVEYAALTAETNNDN